MYQYEAHLWLQLGERRQTILVSLKQPMTVKQLSVRTGYCNKSCMAALSELKAYNLVYCLNHNSRRSRVYWLSENGKSCQAKLREERTLALFKYDFPRVNWGKYGFVCYSSRCAILKTLTAPMQPITIRRRAVFNNPLLK